MEQKNLVYELREEESNSLAEAKSRLGKHQEEIEKCVAEVMIPIWNREWDILCFMTQDAYKLFTLIEPNIDEQKVVFIDDLEDKDAVAGKRVLLFDVVTTFVYEIFEACRKLKKMGAAKILPHIYAAWEEFPTEIDTLMTTFRDVSEDVFWNLRSYYYLHLENICEIQIAIQHIFHEQTYKKYSNNELENVKKILIEEIRTYLRPEQRSITEIKSKIMKEKNNHPEYPMEEEKLEQLINEALQIMQELSIVTVNKITPSLAFVRKGKNFQIVMPFEGRICALTLEVVDVIGCFHYTYIPQIKELLQQVKINCLAICKEEQQDFNSKIFENFSKWFVSEMRWYELELLLWGIRYCIREHQLSPIEEKIYNLATEKVLKEFQNE